MGTDVCFCYAILENSLIHRKWVKLVHSIVSLVYQRDIELGFVNLHFLMVLEPENLNWKNCLGYL